MKSLVKENDYVILSKNGVSLGSWRFTGYTADGYWFELVDQPGFTLRLDNTAVEDVELIDSTHQVP